MAKRTVSSPKQISPLPTHVAIIMDGNGRWAEQHGLSRLEGHRAGTKNIRNIVEGFAEYQVKYLTLYAFSTENWSRPEAEVRGLFGILEEVIDRETQALHQNGIKLSYLGRLDGLSEQLKAKVHHATDLTRNNTRMTLNIAFNYSGRAEILDAMRQIIREGIPPESITETAFSNYLYTRGLPEPDLVIRTAGEIRLSNFLMWQAAYSEYYFTPICWPDFGPRDIKEALLAYSQRQRRFGGLQPQQGGRGKEGP